MIPALRLVYSQAVSWAIAIVAGIGMALLLLWSSQVLTVQAGSIHIYLQSGFVTAALLIAALFAVLLPMEVYAIRSAAATSRQTGGTVIGALVGTASMSCCAPVIFPSLLSLLGFSGTTILSFNLLVERYWLPLATASVILLIYSLIAVARSLETQCAVPPFARPVPGKRQTGH